MKAAPEGFASRAAFSRLVKPTSETERPNDSAYPNAIRDHRTLHGSDDGTVLDDMLLMAVDRSIPRPRSPATARGVSCWPSGDLRRMNKMDLTRPQV
jgi:hypothetical protein